MARNAWLKAAVVVALALCAFALVSCDWFYNRYSSSELEQLLATGKQAVDGWVDENMPGGEVSALRAHAYRYLSGPSYLTDYVDFSVTYEGNDHALMMNTVTGEVYETIDPLELMQAVSRHLPEMLGIEGDASVEAVMAELYVPYSAECSSTKAKTDGMRVSMVPYGTEDLDAFVMDVGARPLIEVAISGEGPEMAAMHDLSDVFALRDSCGLYVDYLSYGNYEFDIDMYNEGSLEYWHKTWYEMGDFAIYAKDVNYLQKGDPTTGETWIERESGFDPAHDLTIEKTEGGYLFKVPKSADEKWYCIGAPEGSEALSSDYSARVLSAKGDEAKLTWDRETYEYPVLVDEEGYVFMTPYGLELTRAVGGE